MNGKRVEWRGELFAADLEAARRRIDPLPIIPRPFVHTLTVFLHPRDETAMDLARVTRLRAYRSLGAITPEAIGRLLDAGITGKLQAKSASGATRALGDATVGRDRQGCVGIAGCAVRAGSIRVSTRLHHSFAPPGADAEAMRVTVDLERHLFEIDMAGAVTALGQLGPRIEIKGPMPESVESMRRALDPDLLLRRYPNRSLELLFQDLLRRQVAPAAPGFPEMELKFGLRGGVDAEVIAACLDALGSVRRLLPPPHGIERMRRYHLCHDARDEGECTIVETASGRLSIKRKRNGRALGAVLLRDTSASRTTDRDGSVAPLADFLDDHDLTHLATFEKVQTKVPFALANGRAYLISFDHCFDRAGRTLDQVELEHIGTTFGGAPGPAEVAAELESLGGRLLRGAIGPRLIPGGGSKFGYFAPQAAMLRAS
jgi:hypothetical protein